MSLRPPPSQRVIWRSLILDPKCTVGPWARLAGCALVEHANGASPPTCRPGIPTLRHRMGGVAENTVRKGIAELVDAGLLLVEERAGVPHPYALILPTPSRRE